MKVHWRKGKSPPNRQILCYPNCKFCNAVTKPKSKRYMTILPNSFCNSSCQVKWQNQNTNFNKGENNPAYVDGSRVNGSQPNYGDGFTQELRRTVKIRDGYNCQRCLNNFSGKLSKNLDVHHIDCNKLNNSPDNLTCLCKTCHAKTHWELNRD